EPPDSKGAYYSSAALASRVWQQVTPVVRRHAGPFVLVGLSRGGVAALEIGSRIVEELGKPAAVVALSAPLAVPPKLPSTVHAMAAFEPVMERLRAQSTRVPAAWRTLAGYLVRLSYLHLTAMVLDELLVSDLSEL